MPITPCCATDHELLLLMLEQETAIFDRLEQVITAVGGGGGGGGAVNLTAINGIAPSVGCGIATTGTLRVSHATDCTIPVSAASLPLPAGASTAALQTQPGVDIGDVTVNNAAGAAAVNIQDGGNSITIDGSLTTVTTVSTVTAVTAITGSVTPGTAAANLGKAEDSVAASGDVGVFALGVANEAQATLAADGDYIAHVTDTKGNHLIVGNLANDAVDAGNPVKVGAQARTTLPTAVADGDRVNLMAGKHGSLVTIHALREMLAQQVTTITASTAETTIVTAVASNFLDVYGLIVTNTSATAVNVAIKDATAGTTRLNIAVPAGDTRGFMLPACDGHKQATVNNNWTATVSASVTSIIITAFTRQTT